MTPLFEVSEEEFVLDAPAVIPENEGGYWNMQLFRSITSDSCQFKDHQGMAILSVCAVAIFFSFMNNVHADWVIFVLLSLDSLLQKPHDLVDSERRDLNAAHC